MRCCLWNGDLLEGHLSRATWGSAVGLRREGLSFLGVTRLSPGLKSEGAGARPLQGKGGLGTGWAKVRGATKHTAHCGGPPRVPGGQD